MEFNVFEYFKGYKRTTRGPMTPEEQGTSFFLAGHMGEQISERVDTCAAKARLSRRNFRAFDAKSGKVLWKFKTNSGVTGVPSSFAVDGVQYVAVQSGWGVDAQRMQARLDTFLGTKTEVPQGGVVWVFALRE